MKFKLDFERCKGCSLCVDACPKGIVKMQSERLNKCGYYTVEITDESACTSCALCAVMCPDCAIEIAG
jgi:2-oxoglutarate ferredoxin oxidoreductase subunit delta